MSTPANEHPEVGAFKTVVDAIWPLDEEARQKVVEAAIAFCRPTKARVGRPNGSRNKPKAQEGTAE